MNNYPTGAENDSRAPWNQSELPAREIEVSASNTLSRSAHIKVTDYKLLADLEIDYSECNLLEPFKHKCYTIKEILNELSKTVDNINLNGLTEENLHSLNRLATEGEHWTVDEEEVVL